MDALVARGGRWSTLAAALFGFAVTAQAQYCPVGTTYFGPNYGLAGCTVGTCWSAAPFAGSAPAPITSGPTTNYACAATAPPAGAQENTVFGYDSNGSLLATTDPLGRKTQRSYDALRRPVRITDAQTPVPGATALAYDPAGHTRFVTDARSLQTGYAVNGFGETTLQNSPDTGVTQMNHDVAGNLASRVDANGALAVHSYDALNRLTRIAWSGPGGPAEVFNYEYDGGPAGGANTLGRMTAMSDNASLTAWTYDVLGRVVRKVQAVGAVVLTTSYAYDAAGQLQSMTLPSGQRITYTWANRRVTGIAVNGVTLLSGVGYEPFGPPTVWTWGNGTRSFRDFDGDGRLVAWEGSGGAVTLGARLDWDVAGRLFTLTDRSGSSPGFRYEYDAVDRLVTAQPLPVGAIPFRYVYDIDGNRTRAEGAGTQTYAYAANSNRLLSIAGVASRSYTYDAAGNPTAMGGTTLGYSLSNRLIRAGTAIYAHNGLGQRIRKQVGTTVTLFVYDEAGRLVGEYDGAGAPIQETVWLEDLPVGTIRGTVQAGAPSTPPVPAPSTVRVNFAAGANGAVATASATAGPGYAAAGVINGDRRGDVWGSGAGWNGLWGPNPHNEWVEVAFDGVKTLTEVDVITLQDDYTHPAEPTPALTFKRFGITAFRVQYWDGSAWQLVPGGTVTGNDLVWRKLVFAPVSTSRIRVQVDATVDGYARIVEIEAWGQAPARTNYARERSGGVASASSVYGSAFAVTGVNDGDRRGSRWARGAGWNDGTPAQFPDWVQVEFDAPHPIDEIDVFTVQDDWSLPHEPDLDMRFSQYGIADFQVQYREGGTWKPVPGGAVTGNDRVWRQFRFASVTADAVRVQVDRARDGAWSRVVELEAWGAPNGLTNVAAAANGGVASASSVYSPGYAVIGVNDGDRAGHGWSTGAGWNDGTATVFGDWVEVRFDGSKSISEIDVFTTQDDWRAPVEPRRDSTFSLYGATDYELQYWNGNAYVAIPGARVAANDRVWRQFRFAPIDTTRVRVIVSGSRDNVYSRITELEAWGVPSAAAVPEVSSPAMHYVHADHLGTPRAVTRSTDNIVVWRWDYSEPFGANLAVENPSGAGVFKYALRFPGQYFDAETGLHYNYHRDYDPTVGRYLESDPIGLNAGINTYLYALASPMRYRDPSGLDTVGCDAIPNQIEGPCTLRCCARHDECFDRWKCTGASWYFPDGCSPDQCANCNEEARSCFTKCATNSDHNAKWPLYYCARLHRYIQIPGDFPDQASAEVACEYDHGKDRACCSLWDLGHQGRRWKK